MTSGIQQAYIDKMTAQLKELSAKVDVVKAQASKSVASAKIDYHSHLEHWQKKEDSFKNELERVKTSTTETFEAVKTGAQNMWHDLNKYVSDHFSGSSEKAGQ